MTIFKIITVAIFLLSVSASSGGGHNGGSFLPPSFTCSFPSFEEPSFSAEFYASHVCSSMLTRNKKLCQCSFNEIDNTINFRRFVREQCDFEGSAALLLWNAYDLITSNQNLNSSQKQAALMKLKLTADQIDLAKQNTCKCVSELRSAFREANDPLETGCVALYVNGSGLSPAQFLGTMGRMKVKCPQIGCCASLFTLDRNVSRFDYRSGKKINELEQVRAGGVKSEVTNSVCAAMTKQVRDRVWKCQQRNLTNDNPFRVRSQQVSFNQSVTGTCDLINRQIFKGNELEEFGQEIKEYTNRMCNQKDLYDDGCVDSYLEDFRRYNKTANGDYEISIGNSNNLSRISFESDGTFKRVRIRIPDLTQRIGRLGARNNSDCELDSSDQRENVTGEVEYLSTRQRGRILNKINKKVRILFRLDQNDGDLESNNTNGSLGDIECQGIYASRGRSKVKNTLLRLLNAGTATGQWELTKKTVVQCSAAFLLNGVTVSGDPNGDDAAYTIDCSAVNSVIVSGANKTNVIRVKVRTTNMQVNENGVCEVDDDVEVTRLTTRTGSVTRVKRNRTMIVDKCDGDGEIDADDGTIEVTGSIIAKKVGVRNKGVLRIGNRAGNGTNRTSAIISTIQSHCDVSKDSSLEIEGRAARFTGNATLAPGATLKVSLRDGDGFDPNGSIPLEFDDLSCMFRNASEIIITIDACLLKQFNRSFVLARWKAGSPMFPTMVTIILRGTCGSRRRLLQTGQQCGTTQSGSQVVVNCPQSSTGGSSAPTTLAPGTQAPGTTTSSGSAPRVTTSVPNTTPSAGFCVSPMNVLAVLSVFSAFFG